MSREYLLRNLNHRKVPSDPAMGMFYTPCVSVCVAGSQHTPQLMEKGPGCN